MFSNHPPSFPSAPDLERLNIEYHISPRKYLHSKRQVRRSKHAASVSLFPYEAKVLCLTLESMPHGSLTIQRLQSLMQFTTSSFRVGQLGNCSRNPAMGFHYASTLSLHETPRTAAFSAVTASRRAGGRDAATGHPRHTHTADHCYQAPSAWEPRGRRGSRRSA